MKMVDGNNGVLQVTVSVTKSLLVLLALQLPHHNTIFKDKTNYEFS